MPAARSRTQTAARGFHDDRTPDVSGQEKVSNLAPGARGAVPSSPPAGRGGESSNAATVAANVESTPELEAPLLAQDADELRAEGTLRKSNAILVQLRVLTTLAIVYTLYVAQAIFKPVFMAIVLYLLLRPAVRWMARKRIPEVAGALLCLSLLAGAVAVSVLPMIAPTRAWVADLPKNIDRVGEKLKFLKTPLSQMKDLQARITEFAAGDQGPKLFQVVVKQPELTSGSVVLSATGNMIGTIFVVLVLTFFLLTTGDDLLNNVLSILPTFREKRNTVELVAEVQRGVSSYLGTITLINVALGMVIAATMWLMGMPTPVLWGLMVTIFNYIPFIGQAVAGLILGVVALLTFDSAPFAAFVLGTFYCIVAIEGHLITPAIIGRHMSLNPIVVILFLVFGGWMWGIAGAALAVPVLAIIKIACDRFECTRPIGTLLGGYRGIASMTTPATAA